MPVQARPADQFTRGNLLLGFSTVEFEPALTAGGYGPAVEMGILSSEALQKEVELLELERGDAGTLTVDREVISKLKPSFQIETFNLRADVARFVLASDIAGSVVADAAAVVTGDAVNAPTGADATRTFLSLSNADTALASYTATGAAIVNEGVTNVTGDGTTQGDYQLQYKVNDFNDVTLLEEIDSAGAIVRTFVPQSGAPAAEFEAQVIGTVGATSGELTLFQAVGATNTIRASYNPALAGVLDDNTAAVADFFPDDLLGRILFRRLDTFAAPDAASAFREGQPVDVNYTYSRKASTTLQPFRQTSFDGRVTIRHLTDIGINFIWNIPSATIRVTDDDLTFGADDFGVATLILNINDAGGSQRFGTLALSSEAEAAA
jgi:hypothetical protein